MTNKEAKEIMSKVTFYWELGEQTLTQNQINEALDMAIKALEQEPTARWEKYVDDYIKCSKCGRIVKFYHYNYKYCPHCGARMIESEEEDDRD